MRKILFVCLLCIPALFVSAQDAQVRSQRLKVYIDCSNMGCDMDFVRTEINIVDFLLDRQAADVHVLITRQQTGGGGRQFQMIFFGQNHYNDRADTIRFNTAATATGFEERELFIRYLKIGLVPFLLKSGSANEMVIDMKRKDNGNKDENKNSTGPTKDPWNYWVFRIGVNGHADADAVYKSSRLSTNLSANRVTEEIKIGFGLNAGRNKDSYELEDDNGNMQRIINKNNDYELQQYIVKSINSHWSYGYEVIFSQNTFSNNKHRALFNTGVEYNIFPYKQVNTRLFTLAYTVNIRRNAYFDTTLYDKTKETLAGHSLEAKLKVIQKWGTIYFGVEYHNYLHNWRYYNLEVSGEVDIRITGGLSFNIYTSAQLIRDQLFLPKEGATPQEVLTRRRQLASGYRLFSFFGLSYRFGSKLNNFVNPRFD